MGREFLLPLEPLYRGKAVNNLYFSFLFPFSFYFISFECLRRIMVLSNGETSRTLLRPSVAIFTRKNRACQYGGLTYTRPSGNLKLAVSASS